MGEVSLESHDGWAEIILPDAGSGAILDVQLARSFLDALRTVEADVEVRCIVVRGTSGGFCQGIDLEAFRNQLTSDERLAFASVWDQLHLALLETRKVLATALCGAAVDGGASLALAGDLLIAGRSAVVHIAEMGQGLPIPRNVSWLALRHGEAVTMRICLMADPVGAEELLRLGVATEVVDDADVVTRAQAVAKRIARYPAGAVGRAKAAIRGTSVRNGAADWFLPAMAAYAPPRAEPASER